MLFKSMGGYEADGETVGNLREVQCTKNLRAGDKRCLAEKRRNE